MALEREFEFYKKNKKALLSKYEGKFVVIVDDKVIGAFDDDIEAVESVRKHTEPGTFLVQYVCEEEEVLYYHSPRVLTG